MRLRDKFRLFAVLRVAIAGMFPALMLAFVLAGAAVSPPAAASARLSVSTGMHAVATLGEASLSVRIAAPRAPELPAQCFDRHHSCGPGAIAAGCPEAFALGPTRRVSFVTPRAPGPVAVPDVAPHLAASLSILFRNFRE
jgi:hypothetical protein